MTVSLKNMKKETQPTKPLKDNQEKEDEKKKEDETKVEKCPDCTGTMTSHTMMCPWFAVIS